MTDPATPWHRICNLCGERRAYLPRTNWRDTVPPVDPRNVVPTRLELCHARALGALLCPVCDCGPGEGAAPPRWLQAILVP